MLSISQWVTAFNAFVTIYVERAPQEAPKLRKCCKNVCDIAFKSGEWLFHDEQFRFLRPMRITPGIKYIGNYSYRRWCIPAGKHPLPAPTMLPHHFCSHTFPQGTCWTFHAGKPCGGCSYEHIWYKCGAKHPTITCSMSGNQHRNGAPRRDLQVSSILLSPPVTPIRVDGLDFLLRVIGLI